MPRAGVWPRTPRHPGPRVQAPLFAAGSPSAPPEPRPQGRPVRSDAEPRARRPSPPTVLSWAPMVAPHRTRSAAAAAETVGPPRPGPAPGRVTLGGGRSPEGPSPGAGAGGRALAPPRPRQFAEKGR